MAENIEYRIEHDTMGEVRVPADALYRAQTQRAVENFPISGQTLESAHIRALALVKKAAATANEELKVLDAERAQAIRDAADLVATGKYDAHFPIDVFQTGSGTSSNMNANEVLATLATRSLESKGIEVHPNDHVNRGQSSNDTFPTAMHIAVVNELAAMYPRVPPPPATPDPPGPPRPPPTPAGRGPPPPAPLRHICPPNLSRPLFKR